jgi:hypothetical protein
VNPPRAADAVPELIVSYKKNPAHENAHAHRKSRENGIFFVSSVGKNAFTASAAVTGRLSALIRFIFISAIDSLSSHKKSPAGQGKARLNAVIVFNSILPISRIALKIG